MSAFGSGWSGVGGVWGDLVRALGWGFTNPVITCGVWELCLCLGCGVEGSWWVAWTGV